MRHVIRSLCTYAPRYLRVIPLSYALLQVDPVLDNVIEHWLASIHTLVSPRTSLALTGSPCSLVPIPSQRAMVHRTRVWSTPTTRPPAHTSLLEDNAANAVGDMFFHFSIIGFYRFQSSMFLSYVVPV